MYFTILMAIVGFVMKTILHNLISNDLRKEYLSYTSNNEKVLSEILFIVHRLESNLSFIESIIKWISHKLLDLDILKKFDENVNLLGFEDGVYDFTTREFR
jgi:hypothetical protein